MKEFSKIEACMCKKYNGWVICAEIEKEIMLRRKCSHSFSCNHLLLVNWAKLIERSFIWSAFGRISKQGLFPIPIDDISAIRTSAIVKYFFTLTWKVFNYVPLFLMACFQSS